MRFTDLEERLILERSGLLFDTLSADMLRLIKDKYSEPTRHYHTWDHALSVLSWVNLVCELFSEESLAPFKHRDLRLAALLHDVIYTMQGSPGNERDSVAFMAMLAIGDIAASPGRRSGDKLLALSDTDRVAEIIMATAQHGKLEDGDVPLAIALFMDCDIASFGEMRWELVLWDDQNIVNEYVQKYPLEDVIVGRRKFLAGMLDKKSIFLSRFFRTSFEDQAQQNIRRLCETRYPS